MTTTTQLVSIIRFCEDNRPPFVSPAFWDTVVTIALTEHARKKAEDFVPMEVYWDALESVKVTMRDQVK